MANKGETLVALDIGTSKVAVVIGEKSENNELSIIGVGTAPSRGLRKGVVINIEATVSSISQAISQAEAMAGCEVSQVYASISGEHIKGFNSTGIVGIKNREVSQDDIDRVIEAAKAVAIPLDREVLHVLPQEFIIDNQDGIREPLGISGVRLEAHVHIVTGAVASAQNIVKCANRCGLGVKDIVLAPLASAKATLSSEEMELGACVVDIGGGTTDIVVFHGGAVKFTAILPVGGNHITNDIAQGLRTPVLEAEKIKCSHGTTLLSSVNKDDTLEVPSTGGRSARVLSKLVLSEIIEPRVSEIFSLIHRELVRNDMIELLTSGLVLTGGCASLHGMAEVAENVFNLPVRIGMPRGISGLTEIVRNPEYASSAGLLLYAAEQNKLSKGGSFSKRSIGKVLKRVGGWLGEHF